MSAIITQTSVKSLHSLGTVAAPATGDFEHLVGYVEDVGVPRRNRSGGGNTGRVVGCGKE
jgi:hypothetical protein